MSSKFIRSTIFTGKHLLHFPFLNSTNTYAKEISSKTKPIDGTVIITDSQTKGRGLGDNEWLSNPNENLTFSIIYHSGFIKAEDQFELSMAVSLGILNALKNYEAKGIELKWPNDIYYNDKKLGGILIENTISGLFLKYSIIGVGLNINQTKFPKSLPNPISLKLISSKTYDLHSVLEDVCSNIESHFLSIKSGNKMELNTNYFNSMFRRKEEIDYLFNGILCKGTIEGVDRFGRLLVKGKNKVHIFSHGEIVIL